jgi:hypothetical protein
VLADCRFVLVEIGTPERFSCLCECGIDQPERADSGSQSRTGVKKMTTNPSTFSPLGNTILALFITFPAWTMLLEIQPSTASPAPVGTVITLRAAIAEAGGASIWYRYRIRTPASADFRTVRDYSPQNSYDWAPSESEGIYEVEVSARDRDSGDTAVATLAYTVESRIVDNTPAITRTKNKLVFLYSAPPCEESGRIRVEFISEDNFRQFTPSLKCSAAASTNVYLAGLRPSTKYRVRHTVETPGAFAIQGPLLSFDTEALDFSVPATRAVQAPMGTVVRDQILLQSNVFSMNIATDLDGNIVWYNPAGIRYLTRAVRGGAFVALIDDWNGDDSAQILRIYDVAGNIIAETNAGRINEQLAAMGKLPITSFHHEARIDQGGIIVLAGNERLLTDVQGPGQVDVLGDVILVLDRDLQLRWSWDAFDHLDVRRNAVMGETCNFGGGGCAVFRLAKVANDWLHGNSVQVTPDGNLLYSARHQDWLIKIDYANGAGSGRVIWRLGKDGDFQLRSDDPFPWFSHQHDGNFESGGRPNRLLVLDNGNTRYAQNPAVHSRGQVFEIDEQNRTAFLVLNADLGDYSRALGSAARMQNGNYVFSLGWDSNNYGQSLEFDPSGRLVTRIEVETQMYRSFRMRDLYTPY